MWKIYICGYETPPVEGEPDWLGHFENEFKEKFIVLKHQTSDKSEINEKNSLIPSLEEYSISDDKIIQENLNLIREADLVFADITSPSLKKILFLIYSNILRKPIVIFANSNNLKENIKYYNLISNSVFNSYELAHKFFHEMKSLPSSIHTIYQDITLNVLQTDVLRLYRREDRKDALFRSAILATQIGQILHYLTHDRSLNPGARAIGSKADEEAQLGDGFIQFLIYCLSRGFDIEKIYSIGLKRMEEEVWRDTQPIIAPRQLRPREIGYGISASIGVVTDHVVVVNNLEDVEKISKGKCILAIPTYEKEIWEEITARIENVVGLISGTGTPNIHPAIVCRELRKPCIVGAKELVGNLRDGDFVEMRVGSDIDDNSVMRVES